MVNRMSFSFFDRETKMQDQNRVLLFLDFDGTLTNTPGQELVYSALYQRLVCGLYGFIPNDMPKMLDNMQQASPAEQDKFTLRSEAAGFLKHALTLIEQGYAVEINIISRNHFGYIRAVLEFSQQFTTESLNQIRINGLEDGGGAKDHVITNMPKA